MERTLFDNYNINYDEWYNDFIEFCELNDIEYTEYDANSEFFHNWVNKTLNNNWENFIFDIKHSNESNNECVILGYVSRWNGCFDIYPTKVNNLYDAIIKCVGECEYVSITNINGVIKVCSAHHDGTNIFTIHKLNKKGLCVVNEENLTKECYHAKFKLMF